MYGDRQWQVLVLKVVAEFLILAKSNLLQHLAKGCY
jgi:hypothetical protein